MGAGEIREQQTKQRVSAHDIEWEKATRMFLSDTDTWPRWPILPMKKRGGNFELAVVWVAKPLTVYLTNMFFLKTSEDFKGVESITYGSIDELIDAGWRVD